MTEMCKKLSPIRIDHIRVEPPISRIYSRLGFRKTKTRLPADQEQKILSTIHDASISCQLCGVYLRVDIAHKTDNSIHLLDRIHWESRNLTKFLANSDEVFLLAVTAGHEIMALREQYQQEGKNFQAVIVDALGSEMVEAGIDWLNDYLRKSLKREFKTTTKWRYSPGYGDFALSCQQDLAVLLQLEQLGIRLNDHFLLIPEKTVTAVVGIL
jgi:hypothetical protein